MNSDVKTVEELLQTAIPPGDRDLPAGRVRRAIVTGGSTGIGRYTAIALAKDGCDVAVTYAHNRDDAELTAQAIRSLGRRAFIQLLDLESPESAGPAIDAMVEQLGGLDIFVSNAGTMVMQRMPNITMAEMQRLFNINTFGAVLGCQRALRHMLGMQDGDPESTMEMVKNQANKVLTGKMTKPRETPGRIIVITSTHEHVASPADTVYTMTKHALGGFIKCAAFETGGLNVTVNGIRPGEVATPINSMGPEDGLSKSRPHIPAKRVGHPAEIAEAVRFLASDASQFISGVSYDVGGGLSIAQPMAMQAYRAMV